MTATALKFERETCTRCGGSGHYLFNQIDADRCYGCQGTGAKLTKRGAAANLWLRNLRTIEAHYVRPGMVIKTMGLKLVVQSVRLDTVSTAKSLRDGVMVDSPPYLHIQGTHRSVSVFEDAMVEVVPSKAEQIEQLRAAIEYQNTLTKAGTPRARVAA